jgi:hypothetical protein
LGGNGGIGAISSITGTSTYYAGGGGGSSETGGGTGGTGGGGNGGKVFTVPSGRQGGLANTGGGAGGGNTDVVANGGSGVVIIRYPDSLFPATSTTGSPTITVAGGYRVYKWTSSGSITF